MTALLIVLCLVLIGIVVVQIGRLTELAVKIRGEKEAQLEANAFQGKMFFAFMLVFLPACAISALYYQDSLLAYGPHQSASEHGSLIDSSFNITLLFTSIVFFLTHIALFWFSYKYSGKANAKAAFMPHDNKLELIWTAIPAIVMFYLVSDGLVTWNKVMADVPADAVVGEDYIEIHAQGMQFAWNLRYPGPDGVLGATNYRMIDGTNPIGQDWNDVENLDDFHPSEIVLPVGKPVRVRITARDVLHNFYLPHFRVKMDAVPGMPTYFVFTPKTTTEEYRQRLGSLDKDGNPLYPEWHLPYDEEDPDGPKRWEAFNYELACAELCGKGHFSMKREVKIVSEEEYEEWLDKQTSYYLSTIRSTDADPFKGKLLDTEVEARKAEFDGTLQKALSSETDKIIRLKYVNFKTGSATLTPLSTYELDNIVAAMKQYPNLAIEVAGHTDSTGDLESNVALSEARATTVAEYLKKNGVDDNRFRSAGYGPSKPVDTNETEDGRAKNRRTEFEILTQ
ncbi:MAG: OmpA family protein [Bacteroidota bacterium]